MKKTNFYSRNCLVLSREEKDLIMVTKSKTIHRVPIFPNPKGEYKGIVAWEEDFNNQGKHKWVNSSQVYMAKQPFQLGDVVKIRGYEAYVKIDDIQVKRIQDFDVDTMTKEGKNFMNYKDDYTEEELSLLESRYMMFWNNFVEDTGKLGYHLNPYVWELTIRPTRKPKMINERGL